MIRISEQQKHNLAEAKREAYYKELGAFFAAEDPALFSTLSEAQRIAFARACHQRCEHFGLHSTPAIYGWADISILIGSHFYRDPFFRPVMAELERANLFNEEEALQRAQDWLGAYLVEVRGSENEHASAALKRVKAFHDMNPDPQAFAIPSGWNIDAFLVEKSTEIYPQQTEFHGDALVLERVRQLLQQTQNYYGVTEAWHLCFMTLLGMSFGTGFDFDELYPWIQKPLGRVKDRGPEACVEKLASRTMIWVEHVLDPEESSPDE